MQNTKTYKNGLPIKEIVIDLENNDSADIVLEKGYTYKIEALYNFTDDVTGKSTITSTDESVVSYRPVYYIDALEVGNCTLSGIYNLNGFKKEASIKIKVVDKHEHEVSDVIIENNILPTCTKKGSYEEVKYCIVCNKCISRSKKEVKATGHSYNSGKITKEATCTANGTKTYTCTICGNTKTETITKLGHNFVDYKCTRCGQDVTPNYEVTFKTVTDLWTKQNGYHVNSGLLYRGYDIVSGTLRIPGYITNNATGEIYKITGIGGLDYRFYYMDTIYIPDTVEVLDASINTFYSKVFYLPASIKKITATRLFNNKGEYTVYYSGTKEQWRNIQVENKIGRILCEYSSITIHCTDGTYYFETGGTSSLSNRMY